MSMPNIRIPFTNIRIVGHVPHKKPVENQRANQSVGAEQNSTRKLYQKDVPFGFIKFRKINPTFTDPQGNTALHLAAESGDLATIKVLLKNRHVNVNMQDREERTALYRAVENGQFNVVSALLANKRIAPNVPDYYLTTPLHLAIEKGHSEVAKALLANEKVELNPVNNTGRTAIHLAAKENRPEIVRMLLADNRIDLNQTSNAGNTTLHDALQSGNPEIVKLLLADNRVDPRIGNSDDGNTPLHYAVERGNSEIVKLLLTDNRVDPSLQNNDGNTPLHSAAEKGNPEIVKLLLANNRVDPTQINNNQRRTPLHIAAVKSHNPETIIKLLLADNRVDPNSKDRDGNTALLLALEHFGRKEIVKTLLADTRVNPGLANRRGETLLLRLVQLGDLEMLKELLADNQVDPNGMLPLVRTSPDAAIDIFKSVMPDLASHSTDAGSLIKVLEYMADFKPENGTPNRVLTAATNFHLGQVLAEGNHPERQGECDKDAAFRFTLALEQLRNHAEKNVVDIKEYAKYAKALLEAAPDAKQFNLGGIPVLRSDVEDLAQERGREIMHLAINQNINGVIDANAGHNANLAMGVHNGGFLLRGQALLETIQKRNRDYEQETTMAVDSAISPHEPVVIMAGGTSAQPANADRGAKSIDQVKMEVSTAVSTWDNKNLLNKNGMSAKNGLTLAMAQNVRIQIDHLDTDTGTVIREMWTYIQNERQEHKQESIDSFLKRLIEIDNQKPGAEETVQAFAKRTAQALLRTSIQLEGMTPAQMLDLNNAELLDKVRTQNQGRSAKSMAQITAEITGEIEGKFAQGQVVKNGMAFALTQRERVNEGGMDTDVDTVMREMWSYIQRQPEALEKQLTDAFLSRLNDIGMELPCNTGCVQRILDTPSGIDASLTNDQPDSKVILEEIQSMAGAMNNDFETDLQEYYPANPTHASSSQATSQPNDDEIVAEVKKDLLSAAVMERLIRQRGWDRDTVSEQLKPVLDNIDYL